MFANAYECLFERHSNESLSPICLLVCICMNRSPTLKIAIGLHLYHHVVIQWTTYENKSTQSVILSAKGWWFTTISIVFQLNRLISTARSLLERISFSICLNHLLLLFVISLFDFIKKSQMQNWYTICKSSSSSYNENFVFETKW